MSLSGWLTDLKDGVCKAPSSSFYSTDIDICLDASFCVQQTCVYCPANGMPRVRCEQPVCCLLSIRPTHVQFSQVWHVKQCNMLATCQTLLTDLGRETQIPYKMNKHKLYSFSFLKKGQAHKDVHTCARNSKNDCYSCHFPSIEGLLSMQLHYFNRHQDLNIARTHNICAHCTAVFTANIWPWSLYLCSQTRPIAPSHRIMNNTNQPYALSWGSPLLTIMPIYTLSLEVKSFAL